MPLDDVKFQAMRLSARERASLARQLLESLDTLSESDIQQLWLDEAQCRTAELDNGTARAFPAKDVLDRARHRLRMP